MNIILNTPSVKDPFYKEVSSLKEIIDKGYFEYSFLRGRKFVCVIGNREFRNSYDDLLNRILRLELYVLEEKLSNKNVQSSSEMKVCLESLEFSYKNFLKKAETAEKKRIGGLKSPNCTCLERLIDCSLKIKRIFNIFSGRASTKDLLDRVMQAQRHMFFYKIHLEILTGMANIIDIDSEMIRIKLSQAEIQYELECEAYRARGLCEESSVILGKLDEAGEELTIAASIQLRNQWGLFYIEEASRLTGLLCDFEKKKETLALKKETLEKRIQDLEELLSSCEVNSIVGGSTPLKRYSELSKLPSNEKLNKVLANLKLAEESNTPNLLFELQPGFNLEDLKRARKVILLAVHPDKNPDAQELATQLFRIVVDFAVILENP